MKRVDDDTTENRCKYFSFSKTSIEIKTMKDKFKKSSILDDNLDHNLSPSLKNAITKISNSLNKKTHFSNMELSILARLYFTLNGNNTKKGIPKTELKYFLHATLGIIQSEALEGLLKASKILFNKPKNRRKLSYIINLDVPAEEFIRLLSILFRGTLTEKAVLAFYVLDYDRNDMLCRNREMKTFIEDTFDISIAALNPELDPYEPIRDTQDYMWSLFPKYNKYLKKHIKMGPNNQRVRGITPRKACINLGQFVWTIKQKPLLLQSMINFLPHERRVDALETILFGQYKSTKL